MTSPAVTRTARPLDGMRFTAGGPPALTGPVSEHLRLLGAAADEEPAAHPADRTARITLTDAAAPDARAAATLAWSAVPAAPGTPEAGGVVDEATAQAAAGIMAVHGRRDGVPRGLAADYAVTAAAVLTTQGLLAGLLAQARGADRTARPATTTPRATTPPQATTTPRAAATVTAVESTAHTYVDRAALLVVSQYLAATGADEGEAAELAPGGPPFTAADGTLFELETLDPGAWAGFWRALDAPADALRAGWRPFQFRYATGCAPFPQALHATTRAHGWQRIRDAAAASGAEVCRIRSLAERAAEHDGAAPWTLTPYDTGQQLHPLEPRHPLRPLHPLLSLHTLPDATPPHTTAPHATAPHATPTTEPTQARPLAGLTVLEAGRRIQAPLAAHLLGLLGADVLRIEPPGGDPLRGMPPACSGVSARWLALNRGKRAVEIDIKSPADRLRLRDLAAGADVFLHNWAPGKAAELGLDSEDLAAVNPGLVYAYTSGWGTGGRISDAPMGTDFMVQARTGVGEAVRPDGEPPAPSLMTLLDVLGGLLGTEAILAGLLLRERTGRGVRVDSSLLGAADVLTAPALSRSRHGGRTRRPAGFRTPLRTADGWIAPADADAAVCAAAAAAQGLAALSTEDALRELRARGLSATAVTTDLADLHHDPRFAGSISRDAHGAPAVPDPWSHA
ncbi:CoA transferase [Streptomyces sp. NPDC006544]|uniref:CoA transferase n=1 Tax=Streptomyces sp. NPDC006544 TaxID=3154583 RepID=UPI0033B74727